MFSPSLMDVSHISRKWLDVSYADQSPSQKLDIYLPEKGTGPFPVIVSIHGGAWMFGDKRDISNRSMMEGLKGGYAVVCIDYRLIGEARFPHQIYDCKAAIRYIRANAATYQLDSHCIAACGDSAGGYLAALLGTSAGVKELEDLSSGNADVSAEIQAVVCWSSPLESFLNIDSQLRENNMPNPDHSDNDSPESRLLGTSIVEVPDLVKTASPMTYIRPDAPYFYIQHGSADREVPVQQSIHFATALEKIAGKEKVTLEILRGAGQNDPAFGTEENIRKIFNFLDARIMNCQKSNRRSS
jgi:acetyl esterase/lipase